MDDGNGPDTCDPEPFPRGGESGLFSIEVDSISAGRLSVTIPKRSAAWSCEPALPCARRPALEYGAGGEGLIRLELAGTDRAFVIVPKELRWATS